MFEWIDRLPHWIRASFFIVLYIAIWSNFCLPSLIRNDPLAFQASGSIIVAWAIITIGLQRLQSEETIYQAEYSSLVAAINRLEKHRKINEERLNCTFDLHFFYICQNAANLKLHNPSQKTDAEMATWAEELNKTQEENSDGFVIDEDNRLNSSLKYLKEIRGTTSRWLTLQRRVEVGLLVLGTIQWGYGDKFVVAVYSNTSILEMLNSPL